MGVNGKMLILRGVDNQLDENSALKYAELREYVGEVLDVSGEAYNGSPQHRAALAQFREDKTITAFYGFSGGGYNLAHVIDDLTDLEKMRLKLVVCVGAPNNHRDLYEGPWERVYRNDPVHMDCPATLLGHFMAGNPQSDLPQ